MEPREEIPYPSFSPDPNRGAFERLVVDNFHDLVTLIDDQTRIVYASPSWEILLGYQPEEVLGTIGLDIVHPDDLQATIAQLTESLTAGSASFAHVRLRHKDGRWLDFEGSGSSFLGADGNPMILTSAHDITDRTRAESTRAQLAAIVESSDDAIIGKSLEGVITSWNAGAERIYGYTAEEMVGRPVATLVPPDRLDELDEILRRLRTEGRIEHFETQRVRRDDVVIDVSLTISPIRDDAGDVVGASTIARDISDRKLAEAALTASEARKTAIVESALDCIIAMDETGDIVEFNSAAERTFGYARDEVVGKALVDLIIPPGLREAHLQGLERYRTTGEAEVLGQRLEMTALRRDGSEFPIELTITRPIGESLFVGTLRDITDRKQTEAQLAYLAYHDQLTGLSNRVMFQEQLEAAIARARRHDFSVAVLYVDLDNFKLVNDEYGHHAGDQMLREVANRLKTAARETDLVARLGGDEFLLLLGDLEREPKSGAPGPAEVARSVAERIHELLRAQFQVEDTEVYVTTSVGLSVFPTNAADARGLLSNADSAMYRGKRTGPGSTIGLPDHASDPKGRLSMASRLRRAVEDQRLMLRYQPIVDLTDGHAVGAEALIRWPSGGIEVLPGEFLPLAEETGLMDVIGQWVVHHACKQAHTWREEGTPRMMTVNLSPQELRRADILKVIVDEVESAELEPQDLVIEITESAAVGNEKATAALLQSFHEYGLRVAIDDFGTGYSSLSRLKSLRANFLKLDRSFLRGVPGDVFASSVVAAVIELARTLGMTTIAEGVETEAQSRFLVERGCALGQGWLFGAAAAPDLMEREIAPAAHVLGSPT